MRLQHWSWAWSSFLPLRTRKVAAGASSPRLGFTLLELLVVIAILGTVAAISLPAMKGFGKSTAMNAATRQLLDDVAAARQRAISGRTDVYIIFVPPQSQWVGLNWTALAPDDGRIATNLLGGQYTGYALFATRQVGDQPGRSNPRYLSTWRTLPQGTFIAADKFWGIPDTIIGVITNIPPFEYLPFRFPSASGPLVLLPYIGFDYQGRLIPRPDLIPRDEFITLARGSVMPIRDANGQFRRNPADPQMNANVLENPLGNSVSTNMFNLIGIDWLTGRARVERRQIQ